MTFYRGYNLQHVCRCEEFWEKDGGGKKLKLWLTNGEIAWMAHGGEDAVEELSAPAVPANAGFFTLSCGLHDGEFWVRKDIIIAWRLTAGSPAPITVDGGDPRCFVILQPDGTVVEQYDQSYDSYEEWRAQAESGLREAARRKLAIVEPTP